MLSLLLERWNGGNRLLGSTTGYHPVLHVVLRLAVRSCAAVCRVGRVLCAGIDGSSLADGTPLVIACAVSLLVCGRPASWLGGGTET